jgi:DNA-binding CsgD family transcriptional regulator
MGTLAVRVGRPSFIKRVAPVSTELLLEREAAAQALDCMHRGFIVADHSCEVLFSNRTAQKILQTGDGLQLSADGLRAVRPRDSADLRGLIRHAASPEAPAGLVSVLSLWRPSLKRMLLLRITPIQIPSSPLLAQFLAHAAVFLHDPAAAASVDEAALSRVYGLTGAECRLVTFLLNGSTLQLAAMALGVSLNTARTHLKHVFMKTDTNRQTQLISLLIGSVMEVPELG